MFGPNKVRVNDQRSGMDGVLAERRTEVEKHQVFSQTTEWEGGSVWVRYPWPGIAATAGRVEGKSGEGETGGGQSTVAEKDKPLC